MESAFRLDVTWVHVAFLISGRPIFDGNGAVPNGDCIFRMDSPRKRLWFPGHCEARGALLVDEPRLPATVVPAIGLRVLHRPWTGFATSYLHRPNLT